MICAIYKSQQIVIYCWLAQDPKLHKTLQIFRKLDIAFRKKSSIGISILFVDV